MRRLRTTVVLLLGAFAAQCSADRPTSPTRLDTFESAIRSRTAVLIGAGDIGMCDVPEVAAVGRLVQRTRGHLFLNGDIAYPHGRAEDFRDCFEPHWGHARGRWHATPGNHEYESDDAAPYFDYFGAAAGPARRGYYEFVLREWLVLMLNSEIAANPGSPQYEFVRQTLQTSAHRCQIAMWHRPVFSSGPHGPRSTFREMWRLLDGLDVEMVVNAHEHLYERFARQNADGRLDQNGIRQFTVGTGGAILYDFVGVSPNSEVRLSMHGIIRFTLRPESYEWEFLDVAGGVFDRGTGNCR